MGKRRRTKKDKINPKRPGSISWKPARSEAENPKYEANVKRQLKSDIDKLPSGNKAAKLAITTDKNNDFVSVKKDLVKSLILAFLIIASEVVIYLVL